MIWTNSSNTKYLYENTWILNLQYHTRIPYIVLMYIDTYDTDTYYYIKSKALYYYLMYPVNNNSHYQSLLRLHATSTTDIHTVIYIILWTFWDVNCTIYIVHCDCIQLYMALFTLGEQLFYIYKYITLDNKIR